MSTIRTFLAAAVVGITLPACYVIPINDYPVASQPAYQHPHPHAAVPPPIAAARPPFTARLYPANQLAAGMGGTSGVISNPDHGHGQFSFTLGGETYSGEATRVPNSHKGVANASGSRGGFARCDYAMGSAQRGIGSCTFASGARFEMHISQ